MSATLPFHSPIAPLADRLRPAALAQVVGQDHLVGPAGSLTRMLGRGSLASLILWGPPGVGKTTIARLLAEQAGLHFTQISAVFSGVADLKKCFEEATKRRQVGQATLLFVDEIHRFNRAQQDGFLPVVENGTVTLVGATTENPSFSLNGALLSRCQVMVLRRLDDAGLELLLARAEAEMSRALPLQAEARENLRAMADGVSVNLDTLAEAEASAVAMQAKLRELGSGSEASGEFDVRTDKPILRISRRHHGNVKSSVITQDFVHGADYAALAEAAQTFRGLLNEGSRVQRGEGERAKEEKVSDFRQAMKWLIAQAENATARQRYKGLGEMNPEQLWETTMDPQVRRLLKVQIDDAIAADEIFTTLMGDQVEPRRAFIETHALQAANLDV